MQNADKAIPEAFFSFCILNSAFCITNEPYEALARFCLRPR
jgi:hypothetical protein